VFPYTKSSLFFSHKAKVVKEFSKLFHTNFQLVFRFLLAKVCKKRNRLFITEKRGLSAILHQPSLWQWTITNISRDVTTINSRLIRSDRIKCSLDVRVKLSFKFRKARTVPVRRNYCTLLPMKIYFIATEITGYVVTQLVKALRCKSEGRGVRFPMGSGVTGIFHR
jgi:hypothetical protein